jgi:branched-chain amino acid aminotransferase
MAIRVNVDGKLGDENELLLSPLDLGFVFGASVYETLRTYRGRPFLLERHLARLRQSAASLDIPLDVSDADIIGRIQRTLEAASNPESYVRLIVSAGVGELDYRRGATRRPTVVILVKPLPEVPSRFYTEGIRVVVVDVVRNHPKSVSPRIKTSSLLNNMFAMREANARGAEEAVMLSYRGEVAEGSQTNIFLVEGRTVKTPTVEVGILAGITRELVLSLARELGFQTEESVFPPKELYRADEAFITSSTREVMPVVRVDEETIGTGRPGEVTLALLRAYRERVAAC